MPRIDTFKILENGKWEMCTDWLREGVTNTKTRKITLRAAGERGVSQHSEMLYEIL